MPSRLKPADIKRTCGFQAYQRGMSYWKQGRVDGLKLVDQAATMVLSAQVNGSDEIAYKTHIEILEYDEGDNEIVGECSCPVSVDCKHVAATLLAYLHDGAETTTSDPSIQVGQWLESLRELRAQRAPATIDGGTEGNAYQLLYQLEPSEERNDPYTVHLNTLKARRLKRGGFGKPSQFPLEKASETYYSNDFLGANDRDIAQLITNARNFYYFSYSTNYKIKREMGELALRKMLASGRCHWRNLKHGAIRIGAERELEFQWTEIGDGSQLEYKVEPPVAELFRVEDFWYVDLENNEIGRLKHPHIDAEQLETLLGAPLVPNEQLPEIGRTLALEFPEFNIEEPVELGLEHEQVHDLKPVPILKLQRLDDQNQPQGMRQYVAGLHFQYGDCRTPALPWEATSRVVEGQTIFSIVRQQTEEQEALTLLEGCDLQPIESNNQSQTNQWRFNSNSEEHGAEFWFDFIHHNLPRLESAGWKVEYDEDFNLSFAEVDQWQGELEETNNEWFALNLGIEVNGQTINLLPILVDFLSAAESPEALRASLQARDSFLVELKPGHWLKIAAGRLAPIFETLIELFEKDPLNTSGELLISRAEALQLGDFLNDPTLRWRGAEEMRQLAAKIRHFDGIQDIEVPESFNAELRDYQKTGLNWLQFLRSYGFNGILADDMGLGKTAQTLAHLCVEKAAGRLDKPALIVAPTSLVGNWVRETAKFAPQLKVLALHGKDRTLDFPRIPEHDVIVTTYPLLRRDQSLLNEIGFHIVVLDEAQYIKNPRSQTAVAAFNLKSRHRLCLSGTPVENHLGEFWSMLHFLMPGFLGTLEQFRQRFQLPIERQEDTSRRKQLRHRIAPFIMRRTKSQVATELPEKTEIIVNIGLSGKQRDLYESIRLSMDSKLQEEIGKKGFARSQIMILDALLKLRQTCCEPRLLKLPAAQEVTENAKLERLMEMVPDMVADGRRILIFSQFTGVLGYIEQALEAVNIGYSKLTGQTRRRDDVIADFQEGRVPVFLISLKAGGVGLNLTQADTVIHYDPWWNPAAENQATDRAHRIGQDKAVFVYKLITEATVEDRILSMQQRKKTLADGLIGDEEGSSGTSFSPEDLRGLLQPHVEE